MAEHLLHVPDARAVADQLRGAGVAEGVRGHVMEKTRLPGISGDDVRQRVARSVPAGPDGVLIAGRWMVVTKGMRRFPARCRGLTLRIHSQTVWRILNTSIPDMIPMPHGRTVQAMNVMTMGISERIVTDPFPRKTITGNNGAPKARSNPTRQYVQVRRCRVLLSFPLNMKTANFLPRRKTGNDAKMRQHRNVGCSYVQASDV